MSDQQILNRALDVIEIEAKAAQSCAAAVTTKDFIDCVKLLAALKGKLIITGLGKSGYIGQKAAASFSSTGTPAIYIHPAEALHGDLGAMQVGDCLLAIAYSGETIETIEVAKHARKLGLNVIALTGKLDSSLAKLSHIVLDGSIEREACPLNLAPTASTTKSLVLCDCLTVAVMGERGYDERAFANVHPAGSLGRKLALVSDIMRKPSEVGFVLESDTFDTVMDAITRSNFGVVLVSNSEKKTLSGVVTDGDLRRGLLRLRDKCFDTLAKDLMTKKPSTVLEHQIALAGLEEMQTKKITSLPVLNSSGEISGLLRLHDLLERKV